MTTRSDIALACIAVCAFLVLPPSAGFAASDQQPPPAGTVAGAPPQYTRFSPAELERGFLALAFGSDLRMGATPRGIHRFAHPITIAITPGGSVDRTAAMMHVIEDYAQQIPDLHLTVATGTALSGIEMRMIDEKDLSTALASEFGVKAMRDFVARTDPECMTAVNSEPSGRIIRAISFIIVDKGESVFRDCAYHELMHAFGFSNHDQTNPWTTLNQKRLVGYLSVYDRALLTLLYNPRMTPGMTRRKARALLPRLIADPGLARPEPASPK